jgi:hypothetical protein
MLYTENRENSIVIGDALDQSDPGRLFYIEYEEFSNISIILKGILRKLRNILTPPILLL